MLSVWKLGMQWFTLAELTGIQDGPIESTECRVVFSYSSQYQVIVFFFISSLNGSRWEITA